VGLSATVRDPDAGSGVRARYEWQDVTASTPVTALPDTPSVAAPHTFEASLPASVLPDGHTIQWRVAGYDNRDQGPSTPWCQFTVDNNPPNRPTILTNDLPAFPGAPPVTTQVGTPVEVVFEPGGGDSDVVGYYYGVGSVETVPTIWVPSWLGGSASVSIVPVASGLAKNFLTVVAVDAAGNRSSVAPTAPNAPGTRQFRSNGAGTTIRTPGDATGDGRADVTAFGDVGNGNATLWRWNTNAAATGFIYPSAVQDVETTYPTATTRTVQGDFDGDRLSDVAIFTQEGANVRLSVQRSSGNALFGAPAQTIAGWNVASIKVVSGNFDADPQARDDIAVVYNNGNLTYSIRLLLADGAPGSPTFAAPATWYTNPQGSADWANLKVFAGDLDGDGRVDVSHLYQYPNCQSRIWTHFSTGSAFGQGVQMWDSGPGTFCWAATELLAGDFDADGRGDVVALQDLGGCTATLIPFYGNANRTLAAVGRVWTSAAGAWCGGRTVLSTANAAAGDTRMDVAAIYRCCLGYQVRVYTFASVGRSFGAPALKHRGAVGPRGTLAHGNYLSGARGTASSITPDDGWGWTLAQATDDAWGGVGWSSWSSLEVDHIEWLELTLPEPGDISRVVLYPRGDVPYAGQGFPANFTIEVYDGTAWATVVSRTGYPAPTTGAGHSFTFGSRNATRVRITGTSLRIMQFAEVEAYH
jgi:hypothetical protein